MNKVGKVVKKLIAGEFAELSNRAREELTRRGEKKHYQRGERLFSADKYDNIFTSTFRERHSTSDGRLDLRAALRAKSARHFFPGFSDTKRFCDQLTRELPNEKERIIATADMILTNKFPIFNLGVLSYGDPVQWNLDPVHDRRAPDDFYADIEFLNFEAAGDVKVTWEVSRFQFVYDLGQAYLLTGDETYALRFLDLVSDWSNANPDYCGINYCSALEFTFRIHSLCWGMFFFKDSPSLSDRHADSFYRLIHLSAHFLRNHLSVWFSPNTHLFGEVYGLYLAGVLFPEFDDASQWEELGLKILTAELENQITSDGMHAELTTAYHAYTLEFVLSVVRLAAANGRELPVLFHEKLSALANVLKSLQRPDQLWPHIGDEDGGRLYWLSRPPAGDYRPILEAAELVLAGQGTGHFAESYWLAGAQLDGHKSSVAGSSHVIPSAGLFICRSQARQMYSVMQCGKFGYGDSPHSHADMLHLDISVGRDNFVVDPGTFVYTANLDTRNRYRSAAMHNGPHIPGIEFHNNADPFGWREQPDVQMFRSIIGRAFAFCEADFRLDNAKSGACKISRSIFFVADQFWVIHDQVIAESPTEVCWRFISAAEASPSDGMIRLKGVSGDLLMMPRATESTTIDIAVEDATISTDYLSEQNAKAVFVKLKAEKQHDLIWLLMPCASGDQQARGAWVKQADEGHYLTFESAAGDHAVYFARLGAKHHRDPVTDAAVAYTLKCGDEYKRVIIVGGSYLRVGSRELLTSKSLTDYVDLVVEDDSKIIDVSPGAEVTIG